ncbi:hypothetical protein BjapCC829_21650 [Bradyrhizobium barranii]|uniref:Uncharacterized protein n=1 Tax=Bradyrhizobium barranii TaxID=2992140 RepID=A0ABY3QZX6_9BRAD|nr:hypothetical protein [Bradyrhizobium japonicum]UFW90999.1 hypothetical protein BjapCC829_21650 [Bradyrhizobium japonicum]
MNVLEQFSDPHQAALDAALLPRPGDSNHCAFDRAAKVITAATVKRMAEAQPARKLTADDFDDEQAREDWSRR